MHKTARHEYKVITPEVFLTDSPEPWIDNPANEIDDYLALTGQFPDSSLRARLELWRSHGYVVLRNALSPEAIDAALDDLNEFLTNASDYQWPLEVLGNHTDSGSVHPAIFDTPGVKIVQPHCLSKALALASVNQQAVGFISNILGGPVAVLQSQAFLRGTNQPVHIDWPYINAQRKLPYLVVGWVCLEDTHPSAGPVTLFPGGHDQKLTGIFDWGGGQLTMSANSTRTASDFVSYVTDRMQSANIRPEPQLLRRGDILLWHANMPNGEIEIQDTSLTRRAMLVHYTNASNLPPEFRPPFAEVRQLGVFENGALAFQFPWLGNKRKLRSWG